MVRARGTETVESADGGRHAGALAVVIAVCIAAFAVSCNKGPARVALAETDQALVAARPELERHAPEDLARITADAETARGLLAAGQYTDALRIAQTLPERIARASARASARRNELTPAWTALAGSLPASLAELRVRVAELAASHRSPGFDAAAIETAKAELGRVGVAWGQAESAFRSGEVHEAVRIGTDAQARAAALAARIASPLSRARALAFASEPSGVPRPPVAPAAPRATLPAGATSPTAEPAQTEPAQTVEPAPPAPGSEPQQPQPEADSAPPTTPPDTPPSTTVPSGME